MAGAARCLAACAMDSRWQYQLLWILRPKIKKAASSQLHQWQHPSIRANNAICLHVSPKQFRFFTFVLLMARSWSDATWEDDCHQFTKIRQAIKSKRWWLQSIFHSSVPNVDLWWPPPTTTYLINCTSPIISYSKSAQKKNERPENKEER